MADNLTDEQLELLARALEELRKTTVLSNKTQAELNAAMGKEDDALKENVDAVKSNTSVAKEFARDMSGFGSELADAVGQLRENRENFTSLNPAIRAAGTLFGAAGKAAGSMAESAGDAVQGLAGLSKGFKGFTAAMVGGGLLKGFGSALKSGSEAASQMAVAFGEFATGELQNVVEAYRKVGSAGAIGAGGMSEMYESATKLGIGLAGYADVVSRNSKSLAFAGGGTREGTAALVKMVEGSKQYEGDLLNLGFTFSEMRDLSAKFLERNRLIGNISMNDTKRMAEANNAYLLQLDRLARVTGKSRDEIQKQLDQSMKNVRFQATLRMMRAEGLGAEADQALELANMLSNEFGDEYRKGFEDVLGGAANTPEAQKLLMAIGSEGKQAIQELRQGGIKDAMVGFKRITSGMQQTAQNFGGDQGLGAIGKMGSAIDDMIPGLMKAETITPEYLANMEKARNEQAAAAKTEDKNTKNVTEAQKKMQAMGQKLDDIVRKDILPHAAEAVESFTSAINDFVDVASSALGTRKTIGTDQDGAFSAAEAKAARPMLARAAQERQIYASQEFKDWQNEKGAGMLQKGQYHEQFGVQAYMKEKGIAPVSVAPEGGVDAAGAGAGGPVTGSTQQILETIKKRESGGNYQAQAKGSTASGAYQFIDSTWQSLAKKYGVGLEYARAADAPSDVQDAVASRYVEELLNKAGGDVSKVPLAWYTGNLQGKMSAQALAANAGLTPEKYQEKWMADFGKIAGTAIGTKQAALGGVFSGPRSGYSATLHGNEAVVPLPNGKDIPVNMSGMGNAFEEQVQLMEEQTASLEELLRTLRQGADISQRLLRASQA